MPSMPARSSGTPHGLGSVPVGIGLEHTPHGALGHTAQDVQVVAQVREIHLGARGPHDVGRQRPTRPEDTRDVAVLAP